MSQYTQEHVTTGVVGVVRTGHSMDRIRWGPVVAGLFAALSTLALLSVLGAAVGLSSVDRNDQASNFGIGAGIWGAISALIAFLIGGMIAARTAATPNTGVDREGHYRNDNGLLQGAMVWAVAIPLSAYLVASTAASAVNAAGSTAANGMQAAATASQNMVSRPAAVDRVANAGSAEAGVDQAGREAAATTQQASNAARDVGNQLQSVTERVQNSVTGDDVEKAASYGAKASWGLLASMLLGLGASAIGGMVGGKSRAPGAGVSR